MRGKATERVNSPLRSGVYFFFRITTVPSWFRTASVTFPAASRLNSTLFIGRQGTAARTVPLRTYGTCSLLGEFSHFSLDCVCQKSTGSFV